MWSTFNPGTWTSGVTIPQVADYQGIYADLRTRGGVVDGGGYGRANTSYMVLLPGELPGTQHSVTGASWSSGIATLTISGHSISVNQRVTVTGVTPSGFNTTSDSVKVTAVTGTTISYALGSNPGTFSGSGGIVLVDGVSPAYGMVAVDPNLNVKVYNGSTWAAATTAANAPVWQSGSGAPGSGLGTNGDWYLNLANGDIYGPKTSGGWGSPVLNMRGSTGYSAIWNVGAGAPGSGVGQIGDMYLNTSTQDIYGPKTVSGWGSIVNNIKGATGNTGYAPQFIFAAGVPASGTGNIGDVYVNSSTQDVYGPKTVSGWGSIVDNIKGLTGNTGYTPQFIIAAGAPTSGVGNNSDMYINSSNGDVWGPKAAGAWPGAASTNIAGTGTNASSLTVGTLPAARLPASAAFATQLLIGEAATGTQSPTGTVLEVSTGATFFQLSTGNSSTVDWNVGSPGGGWARSYRVKSNIASSQSAVFGAFGTATASINYAFFGVADSTADPTGYNATKVIKIDSAGGVTLPGATTISGAALTVGTSITTGSGALFGSFSTSPAVPNLGVYIAPGSPVSSRLAFGTDGSGWQMRIGKNQAGTFTDYLSVKDDGTISMLNGSAFGGFASTVRTVTANDTATTTDSTIIMNGAGLTETLPASPGVGQELTLININATGGTISGNGKNIWSNGTSAASLAIASNTSVTLQYDSAATLWRNVTPVGTGSTYAVGSSSVSSTQTLSPAYNRHLFKADTSGGAFTLTLPSAASYTNYILQVLKTDSSTNAVTVAGGAPGTKTISGQWNNYEFQSDGTNWQVI